jgi:methionine sulfoxide reductase heme-binding subunit
MLVLSTFAIGLRRWLTHLGLALFTAAGCYLAHRYAPHADLNYDLTIGCGYVALVLLALSLLIGPYKLLFQRQNPVSIDFRRDVGIWAGITGSIHVVCGFQIHMGGKIVYYFLEYVPHHGYRFLLNLFGISNDFGLIATCILVALLVLSNDLTLRWLKGKKWKFLQRFNYLLLALVLAHTFGYQSVSQREQPFVIATIILGILTLAVQSAGFLLYRARRADRRFKVSG